MADILNSLLGQQDAPDLKAVSVQDILGAIYQSIPGLAENTVKYNKLLAPGINEAQRMGEDVYDPYRGKTRDLAGRMIFEELGLGGSLPADVGAAVRQQGFEQGPITGTGTSNAARAGVARNLGLTSLDLKNDRMDRASRYGTNTANLWQPQSLGVTPGDAGSFKANEIAQQNAFSKYFSDLDYQNDLNLINRPLEIGGQVASIAGQVMGGMSGMVGSAGSYGSQGGKYSTRYPGAITPLQAYPA